MCCEVHTPCQIDLPGVDKSAMTPLWLASHLVVRQIASRVMLLHSLVWGLQQGVCGCTGCKAWIYVCAGMSERMYCTQEEVGYTPVTCSNIAHISSLCTHICVKGRYVQVEDGMSCRCVPQLRSEKSRKRYPISAGKSWERRDRAGNHPTQEPGIPATFEPRKGPSLLVGVDK